MISISVENHKSEVDVMLDKEIHGHTVSTTTEYNASYVGGIGTRTN